MDFFEQQDQAHRQSRTLLILFALAVLAIVAAVNLSLALIWHYLFALRTHGGLPYPRGFFFVNTGVTLLFIGGGSLFESFRLRDGGEAVAEMAGGHLVNPSSSDRKERRLLNIVEEMALASGIACPRVYVLEREAAINAFAAGYHPNQAVLAVTQGALTRLTRDELQGVVGHEFSHILNGDMRMNIKLISVLFGIQMIAGFGQELMYWGASWRSTRSRDDKGPPLQLIMLVVGAALFVIGYVGIFFGRLIKSAVSRQREFLADASAVQFTRNRDGIGGALRKIGGLGVASACGSRIDNPRAEQMSHMFLGAARANLVSGLFATHPPLPERLRCIYGHAVSFLDAAEIIDPLEQADVPAGFYGFGARNVEAAQQARTLSLQRADSTVGAAALPPLCLLTAARDSATAPALVYALLLDRHEPQAYALQQTLLMQMAAQHSELAQQLLLEIEAMSEPARLPWLDLAMPALQSLTSTQRRQLLALAAKLIAADARMTQSEFVLQTVLERRLGPQAGRYIAIRYADLSELRGEVCLLLSLVAQTHAGAATLAAFVRAAAVLPDLGLREYELQASAQSDFFTVRQALEKLNRLAPLAKPFLVRALLTAAARAPTVQIATVPADLVRAICAALDVPVPDCLLPTAVPA